MIYCTLLQILIIWFSKITLLSYLHTCVQKRSYDFQFIQSQWRIHLWHHQPTSLQHTKHFYVLYVQPGHKVQFHSNTSSTKLRWQMTDTVLWQVNCCWQTFRVNVDTTLYMDHGKGRCITHFIVCNIFFNTCSWNKSRNKLPLTV